MHPHLIAVASHPQTEAAHELELAARHAGQTRLHLLRVLRTASRNHRRILEKLAKAEHLAIVVIQRLEVAAR